MSLQPQVAALTNEDVEGEIPNYPNLPPQLICQLHDVTMHADLETDQVYAHMTLQPLNLNLEQIGDSLPAETGIMSKPANYFWKTVTASDIKNFHGPRSDAERVFPALDSSQQSPAQELIAQDIHQVEWKFKHVRRGQLKRHFLTTGWGLFVTAKRLVAGDSLFFMNNQIWVGIRRAISRETVMHIDHMAAAAHAASTNSRFTIFYSPRACPSEFVIPLSKVRKAAFWTQVSAGMRFRMLFETEGSSVCRYMGMITEVSDADPLRWANSRWRSVKVRWDESTSGERPPRVSLWEIEPTTTFPVYPSLFPLRNNNMWMTPYGSTYPQSSMYDCLDGSSGILQNIGGNDPTHNKFVKVLMSESPPGRSLDITRFSNYAEL